MGLIGALMDNAHTVSAEDIKKDYGRLLLEDEEVEMAFKLIRDVYIFTSRRLILVDKQGLTGKKTDMLSIPYRAISRFSVETAGHIDLDAELKIWISSGVEPAISKTFNRSVDVYAIQRLLASHVS